jgi:oxygen-independent coproporphyrinogen-3 oxidase
VQPFQDVELYIDGIKRERDIQEIPFKKIISIYLGGGTPSLLSLDHIEEILTLFPKGTEEITIEANPDDITEEKLKGYLNLGINRLSIGVQSLKDHNLKFIERSHSAQKAKATIELAHKCGFTNISIDLMYDLPHQTFIDWKESIDEAVKLPITHLSIYNLIFEAGSTYYKKQEALSPFVPDPESSLKMLEYAVMKLESSGFSRYEISAFARDKKESIHNKGYWQARPFVGLGPSAFSYLDGRRFQNICHLKNWHKKLLDKKVPTGFEEKLQHPKNLNELLAVELRLFEGVNVSKFENLPIETLETLENLSQKDFLIQNGSHFKLSEKGKLFYDFVASEIL